ncbi:hypothetical protein [Leptospira stimsonii]|nr:hypothetical protein [Leptospira stimsonii]
MTRKSEIRNRIGADFYSMQIYEDSYFKNFDPAKTFEKWASMEVSDFDSVPVEMETTILPASFFSPFDVPFPNSHWISIQQRAERNGFSRTLRIFKSKIFLLNLRFTIWLNT